MENIPSSAKWSPVLKIGFRFCFCYFIASVFPWEITGTLLDGFINWVGKHILNISYPITVKPNGSGDTTYNYVWEFLFPVIALVSSLIWSLIDRRRAGYEKLYYWLRVGVRYYLANYLMLYGYAKIFKSQFPAPDLIRLTQTYGKSSPMGLAWVFMGFSTPFNFFMGFFEAIGGVLMLFRKTTLLGACIACTVLVNIVLINFCYDVPVKLFSTHLLLLTLFVMAGDARRFLNFFILNKPVAPVVPIPLFKKKGWKITRWVVKGLFIFALIGIEGYQYWDALKEYGDNTPKPPLYGIYKVQTFVRNNDTLAPSTTDSLRWAKLIVAHKGNAQITMMNDSTRRFKVDMNMTSKTIALTMIKDSSIKYNFTFAQPDSNTLTLRGTTNADSVFIRFNREDERDFLLINRGFHWINEYPLNR